MYLTKDLTCLCNRDALPLATGKRCTELAHFSVVLVALFFNELGRICVAGCRLDIFQQRGPGIFVPVPGHDSAHVRSAI